MAHEVEKMMYVGATPWHGLGHKFTEPPTLDEAVIAAGLNWTVTTEKVFSANNEELPALATRRSIDNKILGVVGPAYEPLQNQEAFNFFKPFIDEKQATIETAGSLRGGQRVFVLSKLALDPSIIVKGDEIGKYVLLSNSHDGSLAVRVGFTGVRVVCSNTLAMAHNDASSKLIRIRHTKNVAENLESVREIMNLANAEFEATAEQFRLLASKNINQKDFEKYVKLVFNSNKKLAEANGNVEELNNKRILTAIQPLFEKGRGNDLPGVKGTYWGAYNAINEYIGYFRGDNQDTRVDSLWFGQSATLNKRAFNTAVTLVTAA